MQVRLFGGVAVAVNGDWVAAGPPKRQCVLAALAIAPGTPVTLAELAGRVWGTRAPSSAHSTLYGHMTGLRRLLPDRLRRAGTDGYRLDLPPEAVDLGRFRRLAGRARSLRTSGRPVEAVEHWREADALVRGEPLAGVGGDWAEGIRTALHREHQQLLARLYETELELGRHDDVVGELSELVLRYPLAESLVGQLMTALYRGRRSSEALECYARLRSRLAEELGTEPAEPLRRLHRDILNQDAGLTATAAAPVRVPAQLPADTAAFTGRERSLAALLSAADGGRVVAVDGMPGIGKTALAVHAARRLAPDYPDGQLYLDLRGFSASQEPTPPAEALSSLLDSLGVPRPAIPEGLDARSAVFRSVLAGRRVLLLLDNAFDETQVLPLLPGDAGCLTVVTSRRRLTGLDDVRPVSLEPLSAGHSAQLFAAVAGPGRSDATDRDAVERVVELCGRLPLAIRIAAARLRSRPAWTVADLLERLSDDYRLLGELKAGSRSVTSALELSYRELPGPQRRLFRALPVCPGGDTDPACAAAAVGAGVDDVAADLEALVDANLVLAGPGGRYRLHDLVRRVAAALRERDEPDPGAAAERVREHYRHRARAAAALLDPGFPALPDLPGPPPGVPEPGFADRAAARSWFAAEEAALLAMLTSPGSEAGFVLDLAACAWPYLRDHAVSSARPAVAARSVRAAEALADPARQGLWLNLLGNAHLSAGRARQAIDHYDRALELRTRLADRRGAAAVLCNLGLAHKELGELARALECLERSAELAAGIGSRDTTAIAHANACEVHVRLGNPARGRELALLAVGMFRELGKEFQAVQALDNLTQACLAGGRIDEARAAASECVALGRRLGAFDVLVQALSRMGAILRAQGELARARDRHREALRLLSHGSRPLIETAALYEYGRTLLAGGDPGGAARRFERAAALAEAREQNYELALARRGLAEALAAGGDPDAAREQADAARELFERMGVPTV